MTIEEVINELLKVSKEKRKLPLYVCNDDSNDNLEILSLSLFDSDSEHSDQNMLAINFK